MEKFMQFSEIGQLTLVEIETKLAKYSELEQEIENLNSMIDELKGENKVWIEESKYFKQRAYKAENKVLELEETIVNLKTKLGWV